jgi:hypothetical protein
MFKMVRVVIVIAGVTAMGCAVGQAQILPDTPNATRINYELALEDLMQADRYLQRATPTQSKADARDMVEYAISELRRAGIAEDLPRPPFDFDRRNYDFRIEESLARAGLAVAAAKELPKHAGMRDNVIGFMYKAQICLSSEHNLPRSG